MAQDDSSLPDISTLCFQFVTTPENSIYYTTTNHIKWLISFEHCDAVFSGTDDYIEDLDYRIGDAELEVSIVTKETSRCSQTSFEYELFFEES